MSTTAPGLDDAPDGAEPADGRARPSPARRAWFWWATAGAAVVGAVIRIVNVTVWRPTCGVDPVDAVTQGADAYAVSGNSQGCYGLWGDAFYHYVQGRLLAQGHGYVEPYGWFVSGGERFAPGAGDPPLYAGFIGLLAKLGIDTPHGVRLMGAVIGVVVVVLAALLSRRVAGARAGVLAGAAAAVYPMLWINDGMVLSESLYVPFVLGTVLAGYRFWDRRDLPSAALLGALIALAGLTRAEALLLYGALLLPLLWGMRRVGWRRLLALGGVSVAVGAVLVLPWVAYNASRFDQPVTMTSATGAVLSAANCDTAFGLGPDPYLGYAADCFAEYVADGWMVGKLPGCDEAAVAAARIDKASPEAARCWPNDPSFDESDRDVYSRELGLRYLGEHLDRLPVVMAARIGRIWEVYAPELGSDAEPLGQNVRLNWQVEGRGKLASRAGFVAYWLLMPFAVGGAVVLWRRRIPLSPLLSFAVVITVTAAMTFGITRYRVPVDVVLVILAAVGADALLRRRWPAPDDGTVRPRGLGEGSDDG